MARHIDTGTGFTSPPSTTTVPARITGVDRPGSVAGRDKRADRAAADQVGLHAALLEAADRADVRPAARAAGAEREPDAGFAVHGRRGYPRLQSGIFVSTSARRSPRCPARRQCTW